VIGAGSIINNRFRLDRLLGRGGFAQVFLCTDAVLGRQVAIKILSPATSGTEGIDFLARFQAEARAVAALDHPNLLGIYDFGEFEGTVYLVMPYIDGGALHDRIAGGRILPLRAVANYLGQTAEGLDYAHRRGIVHRDIKPQNMLIRAEDDRLLIADFGVAKVLQGDNAHTQTAALGTVAYMAPEQLQGRVTPATDIYALGCVLFQLLTGHVPYGGPAAQAMLAHIDAAIPSIRERSDGRLPASFQPLIDRALAKRPADRFPTAGELARAFDALLETVTLPLPPPQIETLPLSSPQAGSAGTAPRSIPPASLPAAAITPAVPTVVPSPAPPPPASQYAPRPAQPPTAPPPSAPQPAMQPDPTAARRAWLMLVGIGALVVLVIVAVALLINLVRPESSATPTATNPVATAPPPSASAIASAQPTLAPTAGASSAPPSVAPSPAASSAVASAAPSLAPAAVEPGPVLVGHTDDARAVAWPASGDRLISGGSDGTVRFWRTDGTLLNTISGRTFAVTSVALSPDGSTIAVGSDDGKAHLWKADGTEFQVLTGHTKPVTSVAWAPDSRHLVSGSQDGTVRIWTVGQQDARVLTGHTDTVQNVAWSSTNLIASASWDKTIRLWR
jgi:serine/threonine protein kinase